MTKDLKIRIAGPNDLDKIISLYEHLNPGDERPSEADARRIWKTLQDMEGALVLLGEIEGQAVTTCTLIVVPNLTRGGRPYAIIENVVTHADFRKQGAGTAILDEAVRRAGEQGCYKVVLTTGSKRESTLAFYEKAGFQRNSRTAFEKRF